MSTTISKSLLEKYGITGYEEIVLKDSLDQQQVEAWLVNNKETLLSIVTEAHNSMDGAQFNYNPMKA